jgi:hypothetical protein
MCNGERFAQTYIRHYPLYVHANERAQKYLRHAFGLYSAIILLADGAVWPDYVTSMLPGGQKYNDF